MGSLSGWIFLAAAVKEALRHDLAHDNRQEQCQVPVFVCFNA